jgi:purine nucleoside phosphorylase
MSELMTQLQETVNYIQSKVKTTAKVGIVLGSGLGIMGSSQVFDPMTTILPEVTSLKWRKSSLSCGQGSEF